MSSQNPRILYVTSHWSHRETCASEIRSLSIARSLSEIGRVEILVIDAENKGHESYIDPTGELEVVRTLQLRHYPNRTIGQKWKWFADPYVKYPHGCGVGEGDSSFTVQLARDYDLVWFSKLRTANMFPHWKWKRSVLDIDDIPSLFEWSRVGDWRAVSAFARYLSWRQRDSLLGSRFDSLVVCSQPDKAYLKRLNVGAPTYVIPNGFYASNPKPSRGLLDPPRIGFIGIFDYAPNVEGIHWFVRKCWPQVKSAIPGARLRLVGRFSDGPLRPAGLDIDGLGWVEDAAAEIATWSAMIVPICTGAGTRGKIAQGFSLKCPIISTPLGAYGYDVTDGREMRLAQSAEAFANACIDVVVNAERSAEMAEKAWRRFLEEWTWEAIGPCIRAAAEGSLNREGISGQTNVSRHEMEGFEKTTLDGAVARYPSGSKMSID